MSTNFPTSLDALTNPTATDTVAGVDHASQHSNVNDAIEAIQVKLGINSSAVTTTHDYKLSGVTGSDKAVSLTGTESLTNKTLTSPVFTTPQINDTSLDHQYVFAVSELSADRTVTLPLLTTADEFVFKDHAVTLTNKTMDGDLNTFTDLAANTVFKSGTAVPIANGGSGQTSQTAAFNALSPTTTKGDISAYNGTDNVRLAVGTNNQILISDSSQSTGLRWADATSTGMAKVTISTTETTITNGGGGTETSLFSTSVAAGTLSTNNGIRFKMHISTLGVQNTDSLALRIKFGGVTHMTFTLSNPITPGTVAGYIEGLILADGATNVQKIYASMYLTGLGADSEIAADASVGITKYIDSSLVAGAVDTTSSQTLQITADYTLTNGADSDLTAEYWIVEKIA